MFSAHAHNWPSMCRSTLHIYVMQMQGMWRACEGAALKNLHFSVYKQVRVVKLEVTTVQRRKLSFVQNFVYPAKRSTERIFVCFNFVR